MAQAIIFDIDGTLLDSVDLHAEAWQEAFRHFGREIRLGEIRSQIGKGGDQLLPVFLSKDELKAYGKELEEFRGRLFKDKYLPKVKPFPGVRELFLKVKENRQEIARLLEGARDAPGCRIFIGSENRMFALSGSSVIAAPNSGNLRAVTITRLSIDPAALL